MIKMLISEMDAINIRESKRVYLDKEIDIRKMIHLKNFIKRINEESGAQPGTYRRWKRCI